MRHRRPSGSEASAAQEGAERDRLEQTTAALHHAQRVARLGNWVWDAARDATTGSPELFRIFGLDPDAGPFPAFPDQCGTLLPVASWQILSEALREAVETGTGYALDLPALRQGEPIWIATRAEAERDPAGKVVRLHGTLQDITERKRIEAALGHSEARFRMAVEAVGGILWTNNAQGEMVDEQPGWSALTGQSREEYQGFGWADALHPEDAGPTVEAWVAAVAARQAFTFEHRVRRHDGAWRRFSVRAIPALEPDGSIREWVGVHTDVTAQHEARLVLARDRVELERLVEARTRELQAMQGRLAHAQRMESLGQLAGGIAHDFNNVLQAVQGGAALIERRPGDQARVQRVARMIFEAAERGSAVTRRLLNFSRRGDLRAEPIDPGSLLHDLAEILIHTLGAGINVRVELPAGLPHLLADKGQLETVLVNLATNARDAMAGYGTLTLAVAAERLGGDDRRGDPANLKAGDYVRLSVADTGTGMAPDVLARVTEPFFTTKEPGKGTGLGLAMARGFAEQSDGGLHIESVPGEGSVVTLWFPVADAAVAPIAVAPERRAAAGRAARLLVVDDEPLVREVIAEQLVDAGYEVVVVPGGAEALASLDAGAPIDLVVSDLSMPEMDGIALVRELHRRQPLLPAILLTGFVTNAAEIAVGGAVSGRFSLLRKPITRQELTERVAMLLEGAGRVG